MVNRLNVIVLFFLFFSCVENKNDYSDQGNKKYIIDNKQNNTLRMDSLITLFSDLDFELSHCEVKNQDDFIFFMNSKNEIDSQKLELIENEVVMCRVSEIVSIEVLIQQASLISLSGSAFFNQNSIVNIPNSESYQFLVLDTLNSKLIKFRFPNIFVEEFVSLKRDIVRIVLPR